MTASAALVRCDPLDLLSGKARTVAEFGEEAVLLVFRLLSRVGGAFANSAVELVHGVCCIGVLHRQHTSFTDEVSAVRQGRPSLSCHIADANYGRVAVPRSCTADFLDLGCSPVDQVIEQPSFCGDGIIAEIASTSPCGGPLDLQSSKRLRHDESNTFGGVFLSRQQHSKLLDAILGLNLHPTDVDQREMLIWRAPQQPMGVVTRSRETGNVSRLEEARHRDSDQVASLIHFEGKRRRHKCLVARRSLPAG